MRRLRARGDTASTARFASLLIGRQSYMQQSISKGGGPGGKTSGSSLSAQIVDAVMPFDRAAVRPQRLPQGAVAPGMVHGQGHKPRHGAADGDIRGV